MIICNGKLRLLGLSISCFILFYIMGDKKRKNYESTFMIMVFKERDMRKEGKKRVQESNGKPVAKTTGNVQPNQ